MRRTSTRVLAVAAAAALTLSACGDSDDGSDDAADGNGGDSQNAASYLPDVNAEGSKPFGDSITIGTKIDQPGTGIRVGGEYQGMDVDVARAVAAHLGYGESDISWQEAPTPQREELLVNEQIDFIVATYSITDERKQRVQFAGPYFISGQDLLVRADEDSIGGPDDLTGKALCSVQGSTPAQRIAENYDGVELINYDTYSLCMEALSSGVVDALTTDDVILAGYAAQEQWAGQFKVVGNVFSEELYGIGLNKDSEACEEMNEIITTIWEDGTVEAIIEANLGDANYTASDANPPQAGGHCG